MERADKRFDEIVHKEIKSKISEAFLDLEGNIRISAFGTEPEVTKECAELVMKKGESMKEELNLFIDSQITRIIHESIVRLQNANQSTGLLAETLNLLRK